MLAFIQMYTVNLPSTCALLWSSRHVLPCHEIFYRCSRTSVMFSLCGHWGCDTLVWMVATSCLLEYVVAIFGVDTSRLRGRCLIISTGARTLFLSAIVTNLYIISTVQCHKYKNCLVSC
jgi:hypothetical protein